MLFAAVCIAVSWPALALDGGDVSIEHRGLSLNGRLALTEGRQASNVVLITHGTLAHHRMELIAVLQDLLLERGISSLATTLSLGVSNRRGAYDCQAPHRHKHRDALDEIGAWLAWLKAGGVGNVTLLGHSRGGNQTAWFAAERDDPAVTGVVLVAPMTWTAAKVAERYQTRNGTGLVKRRDQARNAGPETMLENVGFLHCRDASVRADSFLSYYAPDDRFDTPALLPKIAKPTLVIAGSADVTVPDVPERVAGHVDENTTLVVVEDADHFFRDLYAEDVADVIAAFLGR